MTRIGLTILALLAFAGCNRGGQVDRAKLNALVTPPELARGDSLFHAACAACHGPRGVGTDHGPPLVHAIYGPGHHGDAAFLFAARRGVAGHHWRFGDMQPVAGVTDADVVAITAYARWLQREVGIR